MIKQRLPTLAIVIPAYNEASVIEKCLMSCIMQMVKADEILVVNNKSTDETVAVAKAFMRAHPDEHIRLLQQNKAQGLNPTRNHGFAAASAEIYGRIDADSIIDPGWVEQVKLCFADPAVDAASGPVRYHDMPIGRVVLKVDERVRKTLDSMAKDYKFLFGSNMAIRAAAWEAIKGEVCIDKEDLLHEDIDIALHLFQNNFNIVYSPKMIGGMSARRLEDSPRDFYNYVMRFDRTFKLHGVKSARARIPIFIYLLIYFPSRAVRKLYDSESGRFSFEKLRKIRNRQEV